MVSAVLRIVGFNVVGIAAVNEFGFMQQFILVIIGHSCRLINFIVVLFLQISHHLLHSKIAARSAAWR